MANSYIILPPDSTGKSLQTFLNNVGGYNVHAEGVVLVDPTGLTFGTATNPIYASPAGTFTIAGSVSVGNFPATQSIAGNVTANQSGGWTVGITGTPTVMLSGTGTISGTVTALQSTGSNLHVVVDSAPTTSVTGTVTANQGNPPWPVTQSGTWGVSQNAPWQVANNPGDAFVSALADSDGNLVGVTDNALDVHIKQEDAVAIADSTGQGLTSISGALNVNTAQYGGSAVSVSNPFNVQPVSSYFFASSGNTSTAQLAPGGVFTGAIESVLSQPAISLLITSDQPILLTLNQYIDPAGVYLASTVTYKLNASQGFAQSLTLNANYFNLVVTNVGTAATTLLNINTYYGTIFPAGQTVSQLSVPVVIASDQNVPVALAKGLSPDVSTLLSLLTLEQQNSEFLRQINASLYALLLVLQASSTAINCNTDEEISAELTTIN